VTAEDYRSKAPYRGLLFGYPIAALHQTGYNILLASSTISPSDTLALKVLELYSYCNRFVPELEKNMSENVNRNMTMLSETQPWYSEIINGKATEDFITYATNESQYRNLINSHYILVFQNYLQFIKSIKTGMGQLLVAIEKRKNPV